MADEVKEKDQALMEDVGEGPGFLSTTIKGLIAFLVVILVLLALFCLQKVEAWEVGLRYWNLPAPPIANRGDVDVLEPGYNVIIPYLHQNLVKYDCRVKRFEMAPPYPDVQPDLPPLQVRTAKDQDEIEVYVTILYHVDRELVKQKTASLRETYINDEQIREKGIKAVCPQILQSRLGQIMTANQFYSMTAEKRERVRQRLTQLDDVIGGYENALAQEKKVDDKLLEVRKQIVVLRADLERAKRGAESDRDGKVAEITAKIEIKESDAADLETDLKRARDEVSTAETKAMDLDVPGVMEEEPTLDQKLALLQKEYANLHKLYPNDAYLLDRATQLAAAKQEMQEYFSPFGIDITDVLIWDFKFKDEIEASIISKVIADEKVEMERAFKAAAAARAIWQKKVAEANAAAEIELARGRAKTREIDAAASRYMTEKQAVGDRMILEAQAEGKGRSNQALAGKGGQVYVGMEYAKALGGINLIVLPAGADGINPLDLTAAAAKAQPGVK